MILRRYKQRSLIALLMAVVTSVLRISQWSQPLDWLLYDAAVFTIPQQLSDDIVIVAIDEKSLLEIGRWPWDRRYHAELLQQLSQSKPAVIGVDILFSEHSQANPESDLQLAKQIGYHENVVLPVFIELLPSNYQYLQVLPITELSTAAAALGHVQLVVDSDGEARSLYLRQGLGHAEHLHFSAAMYRQLNGGAIPLVNPYKNTLGQGLVREQLRLIPVVGDADGFATYSFVDVLKGRVKPAVFSGKAVLIGATAQGMDRFNTPAGLLPGVELNAQILQGLINDSLVTPLSEPIILTISTLLSALLVFFLSGFSARLSSFILLAVLALLILFSLFQLHMNIWFPSASILLALILSYPIFNWLRISADMRTLGKELERLNCEQHIVDVTSVTDNISTGMRFLSGFFPVRGWAIFDSKQTVINSNGSVLPNIDFSSFSEGWNSSDSVSERKFSTVDGNIYVLIYWLDNECLSNKQLNFIFPIDNWLVKAGFDHKIVERSIVSLVKANKRADENKSVLVESLEQLQDGIFLLEFSGRILTINRQANVLLPDANVGGDIFQILSSVSLSAQKNWRHLLRDLLLDNESFSIEGRLTGGDSVQCKGGVIQADRPLVLLILSDITALKKSERSRMEAMDFLSHDIRAPMVSVLALIDKSQNSAQLSDVQQTLLKISDYMGRSITYVDNYIHLSKVESNANLLFEKCLIDSIVADSAAQIFHFAQSRNITVRIDDENSEIWVECERTLLERMFLNLIDNAIKYSPLNSVVKISAVPLTFTSTPSDSD